MGYVLLSSDPSPFLLALSQSHARPTAVLVDEFDAGCFQGRRTAKSNDRPDATVHFKRLNRRLTMPEGQAAERHEPRHQPI